MSDGGTGPNIDDHQRAMSVLRAALDAEGQCRRQVIDELSNGDQALRSNVHSLLDSHERAAGFLETPAIGTASAAAAIEDESASMLVGRRIGRYTVRALLGRGGMGAVLLAEQDEPRREVALKVLPATMLALSRDSLRRFRRETRVLARLQHPNIAAIYEAGTHDDGSGATPFFAMEHVVGARTITGHAADRHLSLSDRLQLFLQTCEAVHFGHQRGVIHRDLKPANILVNAEGAVKVIDFGIARLLADDDATEVPAPPTATGAGLPLGTPAYMSPEQFSAGAADLDIRTDVFALGMVLKDLLAEISSVPADLRTIVGKATEQERHRRYQSVADLARDVRRFLNSQPIEARPPSAAYALRMFVRRNAGLVAALGLALALLITGATVSAVLAVGQARARARAEQQAAIAGETVGFLNDSLLASADPYFSSNPDLTVREVVDAAAGRIDGAYRDQPLVEAAVRLMIGRIYVNLGRYDAAQPHLERALALRRQFAGDHQPATFEAMHQLALLRHHQRRYVEAEELLKQTIERRTALLGADHSDTLDSQHLLASVWLRTARAPQAEVLFRQVLERRQRAFPADDSQRLQSLDGVARACMELGRYADAQKLYQQVLDDARTRWGEEHRFTIYAAGNLARILLKLGQQTRGIEILAPTLERAQRLLGPEHPDVLVYMGDLGALYLGAGGIEQAAPLLENALQLSRKVNGSNNACTINCVMSVARLRQAQGRLEEAESLLRQALEESTRLQGPEHSDTLTAQDNLGLVVDGRGRPLEAEALIRRSLEIRERTQGPTHPETLTTRHNLAFTLGNQQRFEEAAAMFREVAQQMRETLGAQHPDVALALTNLGYVAARQGRADEAEQVLREAIDCWRASGSGGKYFVNALGHLASMLRAQRRYEEAEPLLREAVDLQQRILRPDNPGLGVAKGLLGDTLLALGRFAEAEPLLLECWQRVQGSTEANQRQVAERLATLYREWGREDEALAWRERALALPATSQPARTGER